MFYADLLAVDPAKDGRNARLARRVRLLWRMQQLGGGLHSMSAL